MGSGAVYDGGILFDNGSIGGTDGSRHVGSEV